MASIRLTLRLYRFEVYAFAAILVGLSVAAIGLAAYLAGIRPGPECFIYDVNGQTPRSCDQALQAFQNAQALGAVVVGPLVTVTSLIGVFLGIPIVARELERGTTRLAWSLSPSRWRWFAVRVIPMAVILVAVTFLAGVATDRYVAATSSQADLTASFQGYGFRGGLLAARALWIFGVAVLVGAIVGRTLPALLVALFAASLAIYAGQALYQTVILKNEAIPVALDEGFYSSSYDRDLHFDTVWQLPDGTLVGYEYFGDQGPPYDETTGIPRYPQFEYLVPGDRYREVEAREAAAWIAGTLGALLIAGVVIQRRRPG